MTRINMWFAKQKTVLISDLISNLHVGMLELSIVNVMLLMESRLPPCDHEYNNIVGV